MVSDGWSITKHSLLINGLMVNSIGATFIYVNEFYKIENFDHAKC